MSANFWSVRSNTLAKLIPKVKCRYLERSCPRSNGAARSRTAKQRIELRIVFIFISPTNSYELEIRAAYCFVATSPFGAQAFSRQNPLQRPGQCIAGCAAIGRRQLHSKLKRNASRSPRLIVVGVPRRRLEGADLARPQQRDLSASGRCSSGDLVEGGIGNLIGLYLRSSVNHLRQGLRHIGVSSAVVAFRVFCLVPQTNTKCFFSSRCDKRDFVPESFLFSKQGKDFPFQSLGELGNAALQMHGDFACKHVNLLRTVPR